ncbi:MAG: TIGR04076 family protein [Candidatus Kariarchaeaceae archaeon]|jgi:uncharacterized repeat protein (TIGR04076 family)
MTRLKITVLRKFTPEDVFGKEMRFRTGEKVEACFHEEGQEFIVTDPVISPKGLCSWAFRDLSRDIYLLYFGGDIADIEPNVVYVPCNDGKRPVVFKLERIVD